MDRRLVPTILLFALIAMIYFVGQGVQSRGNFAYVAITGSDTLKIEIIRNDVPNRKACERTTVLLAAVMIANCPGCKITKTRCLETLPAGQRALFDEAPVSFPTARMQGGVVSYLSSNAEEALQACTLSAAARIGPEMKSLVSCFAPGTLRPLSLEASKRLRDTRLAFVALGAAGLLAAFCLAAYLILRYRTRRENAAASVRVTEHAGLTPLEFDPWPVKLTLAVTDLIVLIAIFLAVAWPLAIRPWGGGSSETNALLLHLSLAIVTVAWFWVVSEHYSVRRPFWDELRETSRVIGTMFLISGAVTFAAGLESSRPAYLSIWLLSLLILPIGRFAARGLLDIAGAWAMPTVIIGAGKNADDAVKVLRAERSMGYALIAQVWTKDRGENCSSDPVDPARLPYIATSIDELLATLQRLGSPQVVVAMDSLSDPQSQRLVQKLSSSVRNVHIIPSIRGLPLFGTRLSHFFSHDILFMTVRNNLSRRAYRWLKRGFDLIAASALTITLLPLLLALAYAVRKDGGAATYGHTRIGRGGKEFRCLKFRSMQMHADKVLHDLLRNDPTAQAEWEKDFKLKNDPRITRIGHFLRKSSLDELPQLINVIRGEMSLVGPRPIVEAELERYGEQAALYLQVNPGITGIWQISGRNDTTYAERVALDTWYVQNWSLWYDIAILFGTVKVVLGRKGAY